jgi:hypothetical protein
MPTKLLALCCLLIALPALAIPAPWLLAQEPGLVELLASRHVADARGALGRNRAAYFHARFQTGVHSVATAARVQRDPSLAERSLRSIHYAFEHQQADGGFAFALPPALASERPPSRADLASGSAFFLASAGSALLLLGEGETGEAAGDWLGPELRARRQALRPALSRSLRYLMQDRETLLRADARAPNRLLFNALALHSLGRVLGDEAALSAASEFTQAALALQHADGYFIEGGGHDTSYNGVACAVGFRLLALDPDNQALADALVRAMAWQRQHILASGEISTQGNTRVRPGGETFLGAAKGMDVAHTVEALALAAAFTGDDAWNEVAHRVVSHYRR